MRHLAADESRHYGMFVGVARHHRQRLHEAERILGEIIEIDLGTTDYPGLFVFTLRGPLFERSFLEAAAQHILRRLYVSGR